MDRSTTEAMSRIIHFTTKIREKSKYICMHENGKSYKYM